MSPLLSKAHVEEIECDDPIDVYDLELEDDTHTFFANNILVHNTDSIFVKFDNALKSIYGDSFDEVSDSERIDKVIEMNEGCANYINNILIPDMLNRHHTSPTNSMAVKFNFNLKQELVMRRSVFFPKKKKYAIYIVKQEGKDCNKINNPGMEIVRSDYPSFTRNMMKEFIDAILKKGINASQIAALIEKYKDEYLDLLLAGDISAGIPSSWNRENYANDRFPRNVKSMLIYNAIYGPFFKPMDRGYRFELESINLSALPEEAQNNLTELKRSGKLGKNGNFDTISIPAGSKLDTGLLIPDFQKMQNFALNERLKDICELYGLNVQNTSTIREEI